MKRHRWILTLLALLCCALPAVAAVTVQSGLQPQVVRAGETAFYVLSVSGATGDVAVGEFPKVDGLTFASQSSSSQSNVSIMNGAVVRHVRLGYEVRADKEGTYDIPPVNVTVGDTSYWTNGVTLVVQPPDPLFQDATGFELDVPETLYVGQIAEAQLRLRVRDGLQWRRASELVREIAGVTVSELEDAKATTRAVVRGGNNYTEQVYPLTITAIEPGTHSLTYTFDVVVAAGRAYQQQKLTAKAQIKVLPFPPGTPAAFKGAIGQFSMSHTLSTDKTRVGEPVELQVEVSGEGNVGQLQPPLLGDSTVWRTYPPTEDFVPAGNGVTHGKKRFRYLLSPTRAGQLQTPQVRFSYFDPAVRQYKTLTQEGESVLVAAAAVAGAPTRLDTEPAGAAVDPKADPNRPHPIELVGADTGTYLVPAYRKPSFLWLNAAAGVLLLGVTGWRLRQRHLEANPQVRIRSVARRTAMRALRKAEAAARGEDPEAFHIEARTALRQAFAVRLPSRNPQTVTATDILREVPLPADDALVIRTVFRQEAPPPASLQAHSAVLHRIVTQMIRRP